MGAYAISRGGAVSSGCPDLALDWKFQASGDVGGTLPSPFLRKLTYRPFLSFGKSVLVVIGPGCRNI